MYYNLSSNLVVAAAWKTMSISCIISCNRLESVTPILLNVTSPGTGTTFSDIKAFKPLSPIFFLNTLNKSFSKTCFKVIKIRNLFSYEIFNAKCGSDILACTYVTIPLRVTVVPRIYYQMLLREGKASSHLVANSELAPRKLCSDINNIHELRRIDLL